MIDKDDWRLHGQERYLKNVKLVKKSYKDIGENRDHDHCEFCWKKFTAHGVNDSVGIGFTTEDNYLWVCLGCYEDFKDMFQWDK